MNKTTRKLSNEKNRDKKIIQKRRRTIRKTYIKGGLHRWKPRSITWEHLDEAYNLFREFTHKPPEENFISSKIKQLLEKIKYVELEVHFYDTFDKLKNYYNFDTTELDEIVNESEQHNIKIESVCACLILYIINYPYALIDIDTLRGKDKKWFYEKIGFINKFLHEINSFIGDNEFSSQFFNFSFAVKYASKLKGVTKLNKIYKDFLGNIKFDLMSCGCISMETVVKMFLFIKL
jgi:hypothetical protein